MLTYHCVNEGEGWSHFLDEVKHAVLYKPQQTCMCIYQGRKKTEENEEMESNKKLIKLCH